jgi:hypothetical protein
MSFTANECRRREAGSVERGPGDPAIMRSTGATAASS